MTLPISLLKPNAAVLFPPQTVPVGSGSLVEAIYEGFGGGFFWNRALLVRPFVSNSHAVLTVHEWNAPSLWKGRYGPECAETLFFAEDAFGVQFGIRDGRFVHFDPETARVDELASGFGEWVRLLVEDAAYYTGYTVLAEWEATHGDLPPGYRLVPRLPFVLGGDYKSENLISKSDVEGMRIRSQLWDLLRDAVDGDEIIFRVE